MRRMRIRAAPNIGGLPKKAQTDPKAVGTSSIKNENNSCDSAASEVGPISKKPSVISPPVNSGTQHDFLLSSLSSEKTDASPSSSKSIEKNRALPSLSTDTGKTNSISCLTVDSEKNLETPYSSVHSEEIEIIHPLPTDSKKANIFPTQSGNSERTNSISSSSVHLEKMDSVSSTAVFSNKRSEMISLPTASKQTDAISSSSHSKIYETMPSSSGYSEINLASRKPELVEEICEVPSLPIYSKSKFPSFSECEEKTNTISPSPRNLEKSQSFPPSPTSLNSSCTDVEILSVTDKSSSHTSSTGIQGMYSEEVKGLRKESQSEIRSVITNSEVIILDGVQKSDEKLLGQRYQQKEGSCTVDISHDRSGSFDDEMNTRMAKKDSNVSLCTIPEAPVEGDNANTKHGSYCASVKDPVVAESGCRKIVSTHTVTTIVSDPSKTLDNSQGIGSDCHEIISNSFIDNTSKPACGSRRGIEFKAPSEVPADPIQAAQTAGTGTKTSFIRRQKIKALPMIGRPRKGPPSGDSKTCVGEQKIKQEVTSISIDSNSDKYEKSVCQKEAGAIHSKLCVAKEEGGDKSEKVTWLKEVDTSCAKSPITKQERIMCEDVVVIPPATQNVIPTAPVELVNSDQKDIGTTVDDLTFTQPEICVQDLSVSIDKKNSSAMNTSVSVESTTAACHSILPVKDLETTKLSDKSLINELSKINDKNIIILDKEPEIICEDFDKDNSASPVGKVQESPSSSHTDTIFNSPHPSILPSRRPRKHAVPALTCRRTFGQKDRFAGESRFRGGEADGKKRSNDGNGALPEGVAFDGPVTSKDNMKSAITDTEEIIDIGENDIITIEKLPEDQFTPSKSNTFESRVKEISRVSSPVAEVQRSDKSSSDEPKLMENVVQSKTKPLLPLSRRQKVKASVKIPGGRKMPTTVLKQEPKGEIIEGEEMNCSSDDGIGDKENTGSVLMVEKKVARKESKNKDSNGVNALKVETKIRETIKPTKEIKSNIKKEGKANISSPPCKFKWPSLKQNRKFKLGSHDEDLSETIEKKFFRERKQEYRKKVSAGSLEKSKMTMFDLIFWNPQTNPMPGRTESPKKRTKNVKGETDSVVSEKLEEERVDDFGLDATETPTEVAEVPAETPAEVAVASPADSSETNGKALPDVPDVPDVPVDGSSDRLPEESKESLVLDTASQDSQDSNALEEEEDSQPTDEFAPRVKIGPDGKIILDEKSLTIKTTAAKNRDKILSSTEVVEENVDNTSKYGLWTKKRKRSTEWTKKETARFYKALSTVGTDFSLMETIFPWRSRSELKTKFKKEERISRDLVDRALRDSTQFDFSIFDESDYDPEEDRKATKGAEKEEKRKKRQELLRMERERKKEQRRLNRSTRKVLRNLKKRRKKRKVKPVVVGGEEDEEEQVANGEAEAENDGISSYDALSADEHDAIRNVGANEVVITTEEEEDEENEEDQAGYKMKIKEKKRKRESNLGRSLGESSSKSMPKKRRGRKPKVALDAVIPSTSSHKQREEESVQITQVEVSMSVTEHPQHIWHFNSSHVQQLPDGTGAITVPTPKGKKEVKVPVLPQGSSNLMVVATADPDNPGEHLYHVYFVSPMVDNQNMTITHS